MTPLWSVSPNHGDCSAYTGPVGVVQSGEETPGFERRFCSLEMRKVAGESAHLKAKAEQPFLKEPLSPGHLAATYDSPGVDSRPLEMLLVVTDLLFHLKDMLAEVFSPLS